MLSDQRVQKNRDNLGSELKDARVKAGYTQKALAAELGLEYYTMISQMELGYISIPASLWYPISKVLGVNSAEWVLRCLLEYQPEVYKALFHNRSRKECAAFLSLLHKGSLDDLLTSPKDN